MAFLGFIQRLPPFERAKSCWSSSKLQRPFFCLLLLILPFTTADLGHAQESREYQLKAAFLFNFAQFVKWPPSAFAKADAPFYIGILGSDPFGDALEDIIRGETIDSHRLMIVRGQRIEEVENCQLVFVCRSEQSHVPEILSQFGSKPILTVSEVESFAHDGGDIDFYLSGGKVRFEINPGAAQRGGLRISSQLLSLGKIIKSDGGN